MDYTCMCSHYLQVHVPGVVESSLSNLLPEVEARLTVIHTTYLVMKYCASESAEQGYLVFKELCSKCFERQPQVLSLL